MQHPTETENSQRLEKEAIAMSLPEMTFYPRLTRA